MPLIVATGLTEGGGLFILFGGALMSGLAVLVLIGLRYLAWRAYLGALGRDGAPASTFTAFGKITRIFELGGHALPAALIVLSLATPSSLAIPPAAAILMALGGFFAFAGGWLFKIVLVTKAAYDQGFAVEHMPARGAGASGPGVKPGWRHA